jgi:hypothetical protein
MCQVDYISSIDGQAPFSLVKSYALKMLVKDLPINWLKW